MNYHISADFIQGEVLASIPNGEVQIGGKTFTFSADAENPSVIFAETDGEKIPLIVSMGEGNSITLSLRGYNYNVQALSERDLYFQKLLKDTACTLSGIVKIPAPMPGLIKKVNVQNGQKVKKGERLFILEAMKMENDLKSPIDGVIANLTVAEGTAVEKNFLLCLIDAGSAK